MANRIQGTLASGRKEVSVAAGRLGYLRSPRFRFHAVWSLVSILKRQWRIDIGMQALVNRAMAGCFLKCRAVFFVQSGRHRDRDRQPRDAARKVLRHVFLDVDLDAGKIKVVALGVNAHDGRYAAAKCGRNQIGGRERFTFAVIVDRRVGDEFAFAWAMNRFATQIARVFNVDVNHSLFRDDG